MPDQRGPTASSWTPASTRYTPRAAGQVFEFTRFSGGADGYWIPGGFPKKRPCRWRNCAPSPPAYVSARKGTIKQWLDDRRRKFFESTGHRLHQKNRLRCPLGDGFRRGERGQMPLTRNHCRTVPGHLCALIGLPAGLWGPAPVSSPRERGEPSPDALSPSCLSGSTDLLHVSNKKVLQHSGVTCHSVDHAIPFRP